jgi:hypothetical protein
MLGGQSDSAGNNQGDTARAREALDRMLEETKANRQRESTIAVPDSRRNSQITSRAVSEFELLVSHKSSDIGTRTL